MFVIIDFFLCFLVLSHAELSQYDQRQSGDVNVQVDLKDLQIFAILKGEKEEYVDYDYAYDYSELTIKPQNRTTPKPHTVANATTTTERIITRDNSTPVTTVQQEHTIAPINNELTTLFTASTIASDKGDRTTTVRNYPDNTSEHNIGTIVDVTVAPIRGSTRKNCRKGYVLNQKGQCQIKMNTTENALLRLVRLSQKLKLRRDNKST